MMKEDSKILFPLLFQRRMQVEKFIFLKVYADSIKKLADWWEKELAKELLLKIMNYWIYWIDEQSENAILEALFFNIKKMIDRWKEISEANSKNWKKWWAKIWNKNAIKDFEKVSKQAKTNEKQTKTTETKTKTSKIENKKEKKENKKDSTTNIILTNDTEAKASEYWNADINECLELIKSYNWWILDWTIKNSRRYAKMLIDKLNKLESVQEWKFTRQQTLEIILKVISQNKYYTSKITSSESIFRNLAVLMQVCKKDIQKQQGSTIILETI